MKERFELYGIKEISNTFEFKIIKKKKKIHKLLKKEREPFFFAQIQMQYLYAVFFILLVYIYIY